MKTQTFFSTVVFSAVSLLLLTGCVLREPEGPAERIGKGIDAISEVLKESDADKKDPEKLRQRPARYPSVEDRRYDSEFDDRDRGRYDSPSDRYDSEFDRDRDPRDDGLTERRY